MENSLDSEGFEIRGRSVKIYRNDGKILLADLIFLLYSKALYLTRLCINFEVDCPVSIRLRANLKS